MRGQADRIFGWLHRCKHLQIFEGASVCSGACWINRMEYPSFLDAGKEVGHCTASALGCSLEVTALAAPAIAM